RLRCVTKPQCNDPEVVIEVLDVFGFHQIRIPLLEWKIGRWCESIRQAFEKNIARGFSLQLRSYGLLRVP
ncbi:hypothetical protein BHE74_00056323, partial [Ensete ventricosum]